MSVCPKPHYDRARADPRFAEALAVLESKLVDGRVVPERVNRALVGLKFCRMGVPSKLATLRFRETLANVTRQKTRRRPKSRARDPPGRPPLRHRLPTDA